MRGSGYTERLWNIQIPGGQGPGRAISRDCRRPGLSPLCENGDPTRNQEPEDARSRSRTQGVQGRGTRATE